MRYLSVCSGIEAASQAWGGLGWKPVAFSEIERFPSAVLAHHYPTVPNWGDMTKFQEWPDADVDVLAGGTPCQSFSVAGLRKGLADPRGNLMLTYLAIADRYRPQWLVWENVPGVLSSNGGRDFAAFLGGLGQLGYGFAYRVLDAQHVRTRRFPFAVPQRRRRVWVVGYLGDWRRAAAVLFDRESLSGHPPPRRESGQGVAASLIASVGDCGPDGGQAKSGRLIPAGIGVDNNTARSLTASHTATGRLDPSEMTFISVAPTLDANFGRLQGHDNQHIDGGCGLFVAGAICRDSFSGGAGGRPEGAAANHFIQVAFAPKAGGKQTTLGFSDDGACQTLGTTQEPAIVTPWAVRRLTPAECERLMGFPDGFTAIPWRGKPADQCPDGPRYKALGNSWAVNCAEWVGERIAMVNAQEAAA
jgi:DNA (cytosine-5)-methyltransferase 1